MSQVGDSVMVLMSYPDRHSIAWDGREYKLEKDREAFVPFEVAANHFGDPRAQGAIQAVQDHKRRYGWVPDRPTEVRRLRVLYGVQHGDESSIYLPEGLMDLLPDDEGWVKQKRHWKRIDANIPRVEMFDLETREKLWTVLEDPLGEHVTPALLTVTNEQRLQSRVDRLEELITSMAASRGGVVTAEGMVAPDPNAPPRQQSAAEQAMRMAQSTSEGFDDDTPGAGQPDGLETIESRRSGAAGLPADTG